MADQEQQIPAKMDVEAITKALSSTGLDTAKMAQLAARAQEGEKAIHAKLERIDGNLTTLIKRLLAAGVISEK